MQWTTNAPSGVIGVPSDEHTNVYRAIAAGTTEPWRAQAFGILRIIFGLIWAVDAWFKWQPAFQQGFVKYLTGALDGQPTLVKAWIGLWIHVVRVDPHVFARVVAVSETTLAIALIVGVFCNLADLGGVLLALVIWTTAEGFGGPYKAGSTDVGTAIIYALVFVALFLSRSGLYFGLDRRLTPMLGWWGWIASGPPPSRDAFGSAHEEPPA
jgi:thiosulfate dehydrogenase (quinone) large subunit